ncbi:MAG: MYXO-CTERM domain-containing protein, partial [Myxococcota bacterium]
AEEPSQPDTIEPETAQPETGSDLPAATPPASELVSGMSSSGADGGCTVSSAGNASGTGPLLVLAFVGLLLAVRRRVSA